MVVNIWVVYFNDEFLQNYKVTFHPRFVFMGSEW